MINLVRLKPENVQNFAEDNVTKTAILEDKMLEDYTKEGAVFDA